MDICPTHKIEVEKKDGYFALDGIHRTVSVKKGECLTCCHKWVETAVKLKIVDLSDSTIAKVNWNRVVDMEENDRFSRHSIFWTLVRIGVLSAGSAGNYGAVDLANVMFLPRPNFASLYFTGKENARLYAKASGAHIIKIVQFQD